MIRAAFWATLGLLAYTYGVFPIVVLARGRLRRRPATEAPITPTVSLIIAARNEEAVIGQKLANVVALDYPHDRLEVIVVSDGSEDATDEIVRAAGDERVRLIAPGRVGKGRALGLGVAASTGEILVFTDANSQFEPGAIRALARRFAGPAVGGVAGNQVYRPEHRADIAASGEQSYWNFDRALKRALSGAGNLTSATGAIYAIRREIFRPIPEGVTDDFMNSLQVIAQGRRLVFAEDAVAYETVAGTRRTEFRRKVRVATRGLRCVFVRRELLDVRRYGFFSIQLFSHKVLLRTMATPLILLAATSAVLARRGGLYRLAALGQAAFYGLGLIGLTVNGSRFGSSRLLAFPAYFILANAAALMAVWNLLRGRAIDRWEPARSARSGTPADAKPAEHTPAPSNPIIGDVPDSAGARLVGSRR